MSKFAIALNLFLFAFAAARLQAADDPNAPINLKDYQGKVRVACVGDSITAGFGVPRGHSYPIQLAKLLGDKWDVQNFGESGATLLNHGDSPYQKRGGFKRALAFKPQVVIIMLGTNDTKPQNWKLKEQFIADYKDLIEQFAKQPQKPRFFICHPVPVRGAGNYGIKEAGVEAEGPLVDKVADEMKTGTIDMYAALKDHLDTIPDNVHPNAQGAGLIAKAACKALTGKE